MYETGWDIFTIKRMPIPTFITMMYELSENAKEMERKSRKKGR